MCHFLLAESSSTKSRAQDGSLNGKWGLDAIQLLLQEIARHATTPDEYEVKVFGGGSMIPATVSSSSFQSVSERNVAFVRRELSARGLSIKVEQLGGYGHRQIIFDVATGDVWMRASPLVAASAGAKTA